MHVLRCFGRLAIEDGDGERVQLRSRKHLALLLYLAAHRDRRHDRGRVARLFWDTEIDLARHSLSQALYDLRQHVPGLDLDRTNREVGLGPGGLLYEGERFEAAVRDDDLGRAVELYGGPFAPDIETVGGSDFERWVERDRTRYRSLAEKALLRRVTECSDAGRWGKMCVAGSRLVDMNPLNEEAHRAVMRGLWLQGDREAALGHFDEYEELLDRELPRGLDQETRNLVGRIRQADRAGARASVHERPRPDMVGREEEFRTLKRALAEVKQGQSSFIVVRGEAGIGKTRLLEEFADVAELEDVRLLRSRCYAAESDVPYGPIIDGLGELARDVAESSADAETDFHQLGHLFPEAFGEPSVQQLPDIDPGSGKHRLLSELEKMIKSACVETPAIWIIDDCQWMDESSVSVLRYINNRSDAFPLMLVASKRPIQRGFGQSDALNTSLFTEANSRSIKDLTLTPLSIEDTKRLLRSLRGKAEEHVGKGIQEAAVRLHSLSGGNPYFITQFCTDTEVNLDSGDDEYPISEEMDRVLSARIDALPERERLVLDAVAVAGRQASPRLVQEVCELSTIDVMSAIRNLRDHGLIKNQLDPVEFNHEIARSQAYNRMEALRRTTLHAAVAEVLEKASDDVTTATLARHFFNGGLEERAYSYAVKASRDAEDRYAHSEAVSMGELAIEAAASEEDSVVLYGTIGQAHLAMGHLEEAESYLQRFLDHGVADEEVMLKAHIDLLYLFADRCWWEKAKSQIQIIQGYFESVARNIDKWVLQQVRYLHLALKVAIRAVDHDLLPKVVSEIEEVLALCEDTDCPVSAKVIATMSLAAYSNVHRSSETAWDLLLDVASPALNSEHISLEQQMDYLILRGVVAIRTARWDKAKVSLLKGFESASGRNDTSRMLSICNNLAALHLSLGNWSEVCEWYEKTHEIGLEADDAVYPQMLSRINFAESLIYQEKLSEGMAEFEKVLRITEGMSSWDNYVRTQANLGLAYLVQRKFEPAEERWRSIQEVERDSLKGAQGRFKALWLEAAIRWKQGDDRVWKELKEKAEDELKFERAEALHLLWLSRVLQAVYEERRLDSNRLWESGVAESHRRLKLTWFLYYGRRWIRRALIGG